MQSDPKIPNGQGSYSTDPTRRHPQCELDNYSTLDKDAYMGEFLEVVAAGFFHHGIGLPPLWRSVPYGILIFLASPGDTPQKRRKSLCN